MHHAVFYLAATSELCPVESAVIVDDEAGFRFVSGIKDFVWMAGMDGQLLYFAEKKVFGVYGSLPHHPGRISFWWLFEDCERPEKGYFAKKSWFGKTMSIANMSSAEFASAHLQKLIDKAVAVNDDFLKQPLEWLLPQLVTIFRNEMQAYAHAFLGVFPETGTIPAKDGDPERIVFTSFTAIYLDKSEIVIDQRGFSATQEVEYEILARNAEGAVDPRMIILTECDVETLSRIQ